RFVRSKRCPPSLSALFHGLRFGYMKKNRRKLSKLMLFASTGAFVCAGSGVFANELESDAEVQRTQSYEREESVEIRSDAQREEGVEFDWQVIDEPAGAERRSYTSQHSSKAAFGTVHKADDLI